MRFVNHFRPWLVASGLVLVSVVLLFFAGRALVIDNAQPSDLAIVLAGGFSDVRIQHGLDLLQKGNVRDLVLDESTQVLLGRTYLEYGQAYVDSLPAGIREHVHVCSYSGDSTKIELLGIWRCAKAVDPNGSRVVLVTSQYHTRRALSIAKQLFPGQTWSAAAAPDPEFGVDWWREREWAKTCLTEWEKLLWWEGFERWQTRPA